MLWKRANHCLTATSNGTVLDMIKPLENGNDIRDFSLIAQFMK